MKLFFSLAIGGLALAGAANAPDARPVVVELFTSQGCSSCPPADAVLGRIATDPGVIAITRPVTYWDRLGWKDTLGRIENTRLQQGYAARGGQGAGVYTPQAVVQGGAAVVGSREAQLRTMIASARAKSGPVLTVAATPIGRLVSIAGTTGRAATVSLLALRSSATVTIGRGENGGRRLRYTNVVIGERPLAQWRGGAARFAVPASALRVVGADRYAVIVQQGLAGPIVAGRFL